VIQEENKRSTRGKEPPLWMKDFVSLHAKHSPYFLDKYMSYDEVNHSYQTYLFKIPDNIEPTNYKEVVYDPKWVEAMQSKIDALQNNHTGK